MSDFLQSIHPVVQALLATCFTWAMTSLGAAVVFTSKEISRRLLDGMLGFAGGVMIAASFWSLLAPAIEMSADKSIPSWFPALVGFIAGGIFLRGIDKILPHLHLGLPIEEAEGIKTSWKRSTLLILAITLHNIPEGLAVGVAFGSVSVGFGSATLSAAIALAIGIGIQNFPEGLAVSMPLRREGMSRMKSFWYGQLSGIVEPIAGVIGAAAVIIAKPILPYALGFAAGAMIFVAVEEVIPESQRGGNTDLATMGAMIGFSVMMVLDVAFS
jgi:ZIP family zinc transporter